MSYFICSSSAVLWGTRNMPDTFARCWQQRAWLFPSWSLLADQRDGGQSNKGRGKLSARQRSALTACHRALRQPDVDSDSRQTHLEEAMGCGRWGGASRGSMWPPWQEGACMRVRLNGRQGCGGGSTSLEGLLLKIYSYF